MDIKSEIIQKEEYIKIKKSYIDECKLFALFGLISSITMETLF